MNLSLKISQYRVNRLVLDNVNVFLQLLVILLVVLKEFLGFPLFGIFQRDKFDLVRGFGIVREGTTYCVQIVGTCSNIGKCKLLTH